MPTRYVAKPKIKKLPCRKCGVPLEVGWKRKRLPICDDCATENVDEAIRQIRAKEGPYYDKWLAAMQKAFGGKITATLPPVENTSLGQDDASSG